MPTHHVRPSRRRFLQLMAASPLFSRSALAQGVPAADPARWAPRDLEKLITDPKEALDVFDFEPVMKKNVPPAHFGYMATGVDEEMTLRANREGFGKLVLRPRRLVDVSTIDMSLELFGAKYDSPVVIAPTGSNRAFHADGEIAVARAAKPGNHLQILSTLATTSIEDAIAARGAPVWFQLYTTQRWEVAEGLVKRAEAAGAPAIAVTLDVRTSAKWSTFVRLRRTDSRECGSCHGVNDYLSRKPNFTGIDLAGTSGTIVTNLTWDRIKRLREMVKVKLLLKGILTAEDAKMALDAGIDGIIVSIMAAASRTVSGPPSTHCRKSLARSIAAYRCSSTAASATAMTSSRRWRWAQRPSASAVPICGGLAHSARRASSACWACCVTKPASRCSSSARHR
jgi:isopentenyl diphosphate isomerase/L-lactate dehydrogenase-like FMN-dependent dehydrogenase